MIFNAFIVVLGHAFSTSFSYVLAKESSEKAVFLFSDLLDKTTFEELKELHWIQLYEINSRTFIFQHIEKSRRNITEEINRVKEKFKETIIEAETVKNYDDVITSDASRQVLTDKSFEETNQVCNYYYGMGIEKAWSRGYTGTGVVVAVTDVGINTDLIDLKDNIADGLHYNFMNNKKDVTPERFRSYADRSEPDHGNGCASLIAAEKGNGHCSAGIAFNARIAPLKIFALHENYGEIWASSSSDAMARSHVYGEDRIDIYSNSWGSDRPFYSMNLDQREAIKTSAKNGRGGQGAIQVFPVGAPGNELANNEYTIAVSAVGQNGTVPTDSVISSCVLTSGLRNGNNLTANSMVTTSYGNQCITSFAGISAATAQIAGIIALALEAKPLLTLSDIQSLIVYSSELECLDTSGNSTTNAAGHTFHPVFGFGLLNASKLVDLAEKTEEGSEVYSHSLRQIASCINGVKEFTAEFCYSCEKNGDNFILIQTCLKVVKTAKIKVRYKTSALYMRITLISPSGTVSVLQELESKGLNTSFKEREQILTSVHFWDEVPTGVWRFSIQSDGKTDVNGNVQLTLFGTASDLDKMTLGETGCVTTCSSVPDASFSAVTVMLSVCVASFFGID